MCIEMILDVGGPTCETLVFTLSTTIKSDNLEINPNANSLYCSLLFV